MASTYSPSLRLTLIGDGEQSGTWGQTTNTNFGSLVEQAITGVQTITLSGLTYTLTSFDGSIDESRNQVLIFSGVLSANCTVTAPSVEKTYVVVNNTTGGFAVNMNTAAGTALPVLNGRSSYMYCDGTNFYAVGSANSIDGNLAVSGNADIGGNLNVTGTINASNVGIIPGGILMWPTSSAPSGFLICNGAGVATSTYPSLFAAIGYTFGGAGSVFNLPNYVNRMPIGAGSTYALGATGGVTSVALNTTNMPSHTHTFSGSGSGGAQTNNATANLVDNGHAHNISPNYISGTNTGAQGRTDAAQATAGGNTQVATTGIYDQGHSHAVSISVSISGTTSATGSGAAFDTISPYLGMYFIIKT